VKLPKCYRQQFLFPAKLKNNSQQPSRCDKISNQKKCPDKRTCLSSRWYGCAILVGLADIVLVPFPTAVCIRVIALPRAIFCLDGVDWVSDLAV